MAHEAAQPRALISYSHDSDEHRRTIRNFADRLRLAGVDAWIDQFDEHDPPESWPDWMRSEIERADSVIVVVTEGYAERFKRETGPGIGSGVRWEGALITADLYHSRRERAKFIPVVLRNEDAALIPPPLNLTSWFAIGETADADITRLTQVLHRSPSQLPSELGIPNSSPDTAFHFDGIQSSGEIDAAFAIGTGGDTQEAIRRLESLLADSHGEERSFIMFLQGVLHHKIGEASQATTCFSRVLDTSGHATLRESSTQRLAILHAEFEAHYGETGPVAAATEWLTSVKQGKKRDVWRKLTRELRLSLAQDWIIANEGHPDLEEYDRNELAEALAVKNPQHRLGKHLLRSKLEVLQDYYHRWNIDSWGAARNPRRVGLEYEFVVMTQADDGILVTEENELLPVYTILMRKVGMDWRIANFGAAYPIPGWPPTSEEIPAPMLRFGRIFTETENGNEVENGDT
ncbi:TIR domain-containing protein [Streptomyces sp. NPDC018055]|uniref:TIR domain-containing protein n=1 Tax=Streptomyces sp. NPDC018055 TaxID=3365038 RepID=UPI0037B3C3F4